MCVAVAGARLTLHSVIGSVCKEVIMLVQDNVRTADLLVRIVVAYDCT